MLVGVQLLLIPNSSTPMPIWEACFIWPGIFQQLGLNFKSRLALNPTLAAARGSMGLICLLEGDLSAGWELYEERLSLRVKRYRGSPGPFPVWDGRALDGQFIFLRCEQGFGDSIQFVRYAPMVAARGGKVIIGGPPEIAVS